MRRLLCALVLGVTTWTGQVPALFARVVEAVRAEAGANRHVRSVDATQVAGTGHFLMMEKPDEFNHLVTAFLDRIKF